MATDTITSDLPEGFVIDQEPTPKESSFSPDLPDGFVIESSSLDLPEGFVIDGSGQSKKQSYGRNIIQRMARAADEGIGLGLQGLGRANKFADDLMPDGFLSTPELLAHVPLIDYGKKIQDESKKYELDPSRDDEFTSKLSSAVGSTLPILASSFNLPGAVTANMATMAESFRQSALAEGASEEDANKAFLTGGTVGAASEYFLGTVGKVAKGIIGAGLRTALSKEGAEVLVRNTIEKLGPWASSFAGKVGLSYAREFTQEGSEQLAQNVSDLTYGKWQGRPAEQNAKLFSGVWDSAFYGGFIGAGTNVLEQGVQDVNLNSMARANLDGKEEFVNSMRSLHDGIDSDPLATPEQKQEAKQAAIAQFPEATQAYFESRKDSPPLEEGTPEYKAALKQAKGELVTAIEEAKRRNEAKKAEDIGPETLKATLQAQAEEKLAQAESVIDEPNQVVQSPLDEGSQQQAPAGAQLQPGEQGIIGSDQTLLEAGQDTPGDSASVLSESGAVLSDELDNQTHWGDVQGDLQEALDKAQDPELKLTQEETDSWVDHFAHLAESILRSSGISLQNLPKNQTDQGSLIPDTASPQFLNLQKKIFDSVRALSEKARGSGKKPKFQLSIGGESLTYVGKNEVVKIIKSGREGYQATQPEFVEEGKVYVNLADGTKESLSQKVEAMNSLPGMVPVKLGKDDKGRSALIQKKIGGRNAIDIEITRWANKNGAVEVKKSSDSADRRAFVMQDSNGKPWLVMDIGGDNVKTERGVTYVIDPVVAPLTPEVAQKLGLNPKEAAPATKNKESEPAAPTAKREPAVKSTTTAPKVISKAVNEGRIYGISIKNSEKVQDLTAEETDHLFDAMKIIAPLLKKFGIESITLGDESARMYQRGKTIFLNPAALSQAINTLLAGGRNASEVTRLTAHEEVAHLLHDIVEKESGVSHQKGYESMSPKDREEAAAIYDLNNSQKTGAQWLDRAESKKVSAAERNNARQYIFKEYVRQQVQLITEGATPETVAAGIPNKKPGPFDDVLKNISRKWKALTGDAKSIHIEAVRGLIKAREKLWKQRQKWNNQVRQDFGKINSLQAKDFRTALLNKSNEYLSALADRFDLADESAKRDAVLAELEFRNIKEPEAATSASADITPFEGVKEEPRAPKRKAIPVNERVSIDEYLSEDSENSVIPFVARLLRATTLYRRVDGTVDEDGLQDGIQDVIHDAIRSHRKPDGMSYFDPSRGAPTTWINQITRRFITDELDRRFSLKRGEGQRPFSLEATPEDTRDVALENVTATKEANPEETLRQNDQRERYAGVKDQVNDVIDRMELSPLQEDILAATRNPGLYLGITSPSVYGGMSAKDLSANAEKKLIADNPDYTPGQIKAERTALFRQIAALINTTPVQRLETFSPAAPIEPSGDAVTNEALRERKFIVRQRENPYFGEVKMKELVDNINAYYKSISNQESRDWAIKTLSEVGVEAAAELVIDQDSELTPLERQSLALAVWEYWNGEQQAALARGDDLGAESAAQKGISMIKSLAERGTEYGQAIQAMRGRMTPEGWLRFALSQFDDATKQMKKVAQPIVDAITAELKRIKRSLSDSLMENKRLEELLEKAQQKVISSNPDAEIQSEIEALTDEELDVLLNYYEQLSAFDAPKQAAGTIQDRLAKIERLRALRARPYSDDAKKSVKKPKVRKRVEKLLDGEKAVEKSVKKQLRSIRDVIFQTQEQKALTVQSLAEALVKESGLSGKDAEALSQAVVAVANKIIAEKTEAFVDSLEAKSKKYKAVVRAIKSKTQRIMDYAISGALNRESIYNMVADGMGLPSYDSKFVDEVKRRAEEIKNLPQDSHMQRQAILDLNNFIQKKIPINAIELALSAQTASMLFNLGTGFVNAISGFINPRIAGMGLRLFSPDRFKFIRGFYSDYLGQFYDNTAKDDAIAILSGRVPYVSKANLEDSGILELALQKYDEGDPVQIDLFGKKTLSLAPGTLAGKFFLGSYGAFRWLAYSGRLLAATDAWNKAGPRMRYALIDAYNKASKKVDPNDTIAFEQEVGRIMGIFDDSGENLVNEMRAQVEEEMPGATEHDKQKRMVDLVTENRDKDTMAAAESYAETETFNRRIPYGPSGMIKMGLDIPAKSPMFGLWIKFTRFSANFTNEALNFAPVWSIKRLLLGSGNIIGVPKGARYDKYRMPAPKGTDFEVQLTKVLVGHSVAAMLLALFDLFKDDDDPYLWIAGSGPNDPAQKQLLMASGWQPNTIKVGKFYLKYENLGALAAVFKTMGEVSDNYKYEGSRSKEKWAEALFAAPFLGASMILDMGVMRTVKDLVDVAYASQYSTTPGQDLAAGSLKTGLNQLTTLIPAFNMMKDLDNMFDKTVPDKSTIMSSLMANVPFVRRANRPALNIFGQEIKRTPLASTPGLRRLASWQGKEDPVYKLMLKHDATIRYLDTTRIYDPSMVVDGKKGGVRQLTPEEHYELVKLAGPTVYEAIKKMEGAESMPSDKFKDVVSKVASASKKAALAEISKRLVPPHTTFSRP